LTDAPPRHLDVRGRALRAAGPFVRSFRAGGHDVLVAGPPALGPSVEAEFWPVDDPSPEEMAGTYGRLADLSHEDANILIVREVFGRLDATAAVPRLLAAIDECRPDVVVHESAEFGGAVAAEVRGVPHARVGIGLASVERLVLDLA
jgi:hypothetical protein